MKRLLSAVAIWVALLAPAVAANVNIDGLPAASSVAGADLLECEQSGTNRKCTATQTAAYIYGLMSADATASGVGALTLATVNSNVGTFGSATSCITTTQNAKGLTTAISAATCTPAIGSITGLGTGVQAALAAAMNSSTGPVGALTPTNNNCIVGNGSAWTSTTCPGGGGTGANPTATAGPTAVNGVATTFMRSDGAPAIQLGSSSVPGIVQVDNTTITAASGIISTAPQSVVISVQTGTNYAFQSTDRAKAVYLNNASNQVPTIAQATGSFGANWFVSICNIGAGTQTLTPTTSTIGGASTFVFPAASAARPACASVISDGTNYSVYPDFPMDASMFSAGTVAAARLPFGTGVGTAAAANLSAAGGLTTTIGSGTATLGTSAITSGSCATVVTVATANVATTDVISFTPNADITAVTGYAPVTTGGLAIYPYPTSGNANFKVCNPTSSSITPGAVTLNFRVTR